MLDRGLHQRMIGGMKAHEIDAPAEAVVGLEIGSKAVRLRAERRDSRPSRSARRRLRVVGRPSGALAREPPPAATSLEIEETEVGELEGQVEDFVSGGAVRVEGRAEIVLSVSRQDSHGFSPIFRTLRW